MCIHRDNKCTVWCRCGNCIHNYSRGTEDAEDLREVCPKGASRESERKTLSWQQGDRRADQLRSRSSWYSGNLQWKLDLLLWPRDRETELPVEACWLSQTQKGQTNFWWSLFWQHWHDLHVLGSHWTDSQQGILCWAFKGIQDEIPSEEASTLQIGSEAFPPGQCTVHNSILVTDYLTQMGIKTVADMLTQEDFHGAFQKLLERYNKYIAAGGDYFEGNYQ